jgi:hypothetical protein
MTGLWNGSKSARALSVLCWSAGLALFASCSAIVDTDKEKLGPVPVPCEPGQVAPCPCRDGSTSMQKCNAMARFDRCMCASSADRDGSAAGTAASAAGRGTSASTRSP